MLRIGKNKELFFWKPEKGFSTNLLKGLLLALCFHLVLFFGLRVTSPPNPDAVPLLAPVAVEIDLGTPQAVLPRVAEISFSPMEQVERPRLLEMPPTKLSIEMPYYSPATIHEPDFSKIEKIEYELLHDLEEEDD